MQIQQIDWKLLKSCQIPLYFTQGLEQITFNKQNSKDIDLLISSGWHGESKISILNINLDDCSYNEKLNQDLEPRYFAEGITIMKNQDNQNQIYQLTWLENEILSWQLSLNEQEYQLNNMTKLKMPIDNKMQQGWGITSGKCVFNNQQNCELLYATDGGSTINVIDPTSWKQIKTIQILDENGFKLEHLNELEIIRKESNNIQEIDNFVFANKYQSNFIYMIDLRTGKTVHKWDLTLLFQNQQYFVQNKHQELIEKIGNQKIEQVIKKNKQKLYQNGKYQNFKNSQMTEDQFLHFNYYDWGNNVLNGIAYIEQNDSFLVTGKMWGQIHLVQLDYQSIISNIEDSKQRSSMPSDQKNEL